MHHNYFLDKTNLDPTRQPSSLGLHLARQIGDANASELLSPEKGDEGVDKPQIGDAIASELFSAEEGDEGDDKSDTFAHTSPFTTEGPVEFINVGGRPCPVLLG